VWPVLSWLSFVMWSVASEPNLAGLLGACQSPGSCDFPNISPKAGDLRSVRITRPHHYYIPIRHLPSQVPSLTGSLLPWLPDLHSTRTDFPCCAFDLSLRAATTTPVQSIRCLSRSLAWRHRSSSLLWRVDLHNKISRPAQCSLTLRPVESVDPLNGAVSKSASVHSFPPEPPLVLPAGARVSRVGLEPTYQMHLGKAHITIISSGKSVRLRLANTTGSLPAACVQANALPL